MPPQYNVSPSRGSGNRFPMPQQIYPQSVSHRVYTHDNDTIRHYHMVGRDRPRFFNQVEHQTLMHLLEISIFPLNNDIVRLTKIMNNLVKDLKILRFKVIFQCLKLVKSSQKKFSVKNI